MALTQMQIIQSLSEAMSWLERELSWDVPATELRHLTGRIGGAVRRTYNKWTYGNRG